MDKYIIANGVSLDEGNKQGTMRARSGGPEVVRDGMRTGWHLWPEGREGACEEGRRASQAKETQWAARGE